MESVQLALHHTSQYQKSSSGGQGVPAAFEVVVLRKDSSQWKEEAERCRVPSGEREGRLRVTVKPDPARAGILHGPFSPPDVGLRLQPLHTHFPSLHASPTVPLLHPLRPPNFLCFPTSLCLCTFNNYGTCSTSDVCMCHLSVFCTDVQRAVECISGSVPHSVKVDFVSLALQFGITQRDVVLLGCSVS